MATAALPEVPGDPWRHDRAAIRGVRAAVADLPGVRHTLDDPAQQSMTPEADQLALRWMPYVRRWAGDSARRFPSLRPHIDDLEGEGLLALTRAAIDFDEGRGIPFEWLLKPRLRDALKVFGLSLRPLGYRRFRFTPPIITPLDALALADPGQDDPAATLAAAESVAAMAPPPAPGRGKPPLPIAPDDEFGLWTVRRRAESRPGGVAWLCRCRCGAEAAVLATRLARGKSAGCRPCRTRAEAEARD